MSQPEKSRHFWSKSKLEASVMGSEWNCHLSSNVAERTTGHVNSGRKQSAIRSYTHFKWMHKRECEKGAALCMGAARGHLESGFHTPCFYSVIYLLF